MAETDQHIREKAYHLWLDEGRPEGRADVHWEKARELAAIEEAQDTATMPPEDALERGAEPTQAFQNYGEAPGLADQGSEETGPSLGAARRTLRPGPGTG